MHSTERLKRFVRKRFAAARLDADKTALLAELPVLTNALGRRTHGLATAPLYLVELARGTTARTGEPAVVQRHGVVGLWDGHYLPGQCAVAAAIDWAIPRAAKHGIAAVTVRRTAPPSPPRRRRARRSPAGSRSSSPGCSTTGAARRWPRCIGASVRAGGRRRTTPCRAGDTRRRGGAARRSAGASAGAGRRTATAKAPPSHSALIY